MRDLVVCKKILVLMTLSTKLLLLSWYVNMGNENFVYTYQRSQFVGYLLGQVPSNIILTRVKPFRYIPIAIFVWGGISICTAATKNFASLIVVRVLLGFAESPFFPGALYIQSYPLLLLQLTDDISSLLVSLWYKPQEVAPRVAILYCGNTIANGFGGLLAAGILSGLNGAGGLAGWRFVCSSIPWNSHI